MDELERTVWAAAFAVELREVYNLGMPPSEPGMTYEEHQTHRKQWEDGCAITAANAADYAVLALQQVPKKKRK